jgi:hypothetical protein
MNPDEDPIRGAPINPFWDLHTPMLKPTDESYALTYTKTPLHPLAQNITSHPTSNLNIVILDIDNKATITMRIINFYHQQLT